MDKQSLAKEICSLSKLTGQYRLKTGGLADTYIDHYMFQSNPKLLKRAAAYLEPLIPPGVDVLAGMAVRGVPIATALSLQSQIPAAFVRKHAEPYGTCKQAEGIGIEGKRVSLITDLVDETDELIERAFELRKGGAAVEDVIAVIVWNPAAEEELKREGLQLHALYEKDELLNVPEQIED
ncbi:orotate phosphoribosyltransferase [Paenibacillus tarimensis]|uniref:orotate phosphoribosyltransferase n=1 Tax=Paenibacillus tarimensis TaxID=416012 RepID=UPI001F2C94E4|nr:orotate phosphoribosyltransferase [Paenibacillus tarimensis]MCF2944850.1 orotate phosphoribosyltransferase [Paenibacillus tarimensis]